MYEYRYDLWVSQSDAEVRIARVLPLIIEEAISLIQRHRGSESAYPEQFLNQPA